MFQTIFCVRKSLVNSNLLFEQGKDLCNGGEYRPFRPQMPQKKSHSTNASAQRDVDVSGGYSVPPPVGDHASWRYLRPCRSRLVAVAVAVPVQPRPRAPLSRFSPYHPYRPTRPHRRLRTFAGWPVPARPRLAPTSSSAKANRTEPVGACRPRETSTRMAAPT